MNDNTQPIGSPARRRCLPLATSIAPAVGALVIGLGCGGGDGASYGADGAALAPERGAPSEGAALSRAACAFASGLNVAWVNFARDVPNPDLATFHTIFKRAHDAGGRVIRWWFHTNGTSTPGYLPNGRVQPLPQSHVDGVRAILDAAQAEGVSIVISLWSFDMLQSNAGPTHVQNQALLTQDEVRQSYVDAYLTPLVKALRGHPALYAYEIFNEPEGMTPSGWATYRVDEVYVQKCVNWFAAAIHDADPSAVVTNGTQLFQYNSNAWPRTNYYSDAALRAAGGKPKGTLDFYEVHYYASNGFWNSCYYFPVSYWGLDKKVVIGEFYAADTDFVAKDQTCQRIFDNGYAGAWAWAYGSDQPWPSMQTPMQNLYAAHADAIDGCAAARVAGGQASASGGGALSVGGPAPTSAEAAALAEVSARIHALAEAGRAAEARSEAEDALNRFPDSEHVRALERFTGAHRHRDLRLRADGEVVSD